MERTCVCMILQRTFEEFKKDSRVLRECETLLENNYSVTVILAEDEKGIQHPAYNGIHLKTVLIQSGRLFPQYNPFTRPKRDIWRFKDNFLFYFLKKCYNLKYIVKTYRVASRENATIYHSHDFNTLLVTFLAARSCNNAKLIYDCHDMVNAIDQQMAFTKKLRKYFSRILESYLINNSDAFITVNDSISQCLAKTYHSIPTVIRNTPRYSQFKGKTTIIRDKLNLPKETKIALYQGGFFRGRGLKNLSNSVNFLSNDIVLVFLGYGPLEEFIRSEIDADNLVDRVKILDAVLPDELIGYTASADIGIAPIQNVNVSYYYSTPNKVWEYIIAGIPFVVSDFPELRKLAIDEDMGYVFDPEDSKDIAHSILSLLGNPDIYMRKKTNVENLARTTYNWEEESKKLLQIYQHLAEREREM